MFQPFGTRRAKPSTSRETRQSPRGDQGETQGAAAEADTPDLAAAHLQAELRGGNDVHVFRTI